MKSSAEQKYLETSIATVAKEDLIVKIFDVLVIAAQQAYDKLMHERDDITGIHKALLRAQRACGLLMGSLDMEIGGDLARNLFRVYEFWHHELVMANMQKDPTRVERLLPHFKDYRETWGTAVVQFKAMKKAQAPVQDGTVTGGSTFAAVG